MIGHKWREPVYSGRFNAFFLWHYVFFFFVLYIPTYIPEDDIAFFVFLLSSLNPRHFLHSFFDILYLDIMYMQL